MTLANFMVDRNGKQKGNKPSKSPQIYMTEYKSFIRSMINSENASVRKEACTQKFAPTKMLVERLQVETELEVIEAIVNNAKTPLTAVEAFATKNADIAAQIDTPRFAS